MKRSTQAIDISENSTETKKKNTEYPNYLKNKYITEMLGHYLSAQIVKTLVLLINIIIVITFETDPFHDRDLQNTVSTTKT